MVKKESDILEIFEEHLEQKTIGFLKIRRKTMLDAEKLELVTEEYEYLPSPKIGTPILLMTKRIYRTRHKYKMYCAIQFMTIPRFIDEPAQCTYVGSYYYKDGTDCSELDEGTALMIHHIYEFKHGIEVELDPIETYPYPEEPLIV